MVKQISDNEIYLLIKYIKSVLWRVVKCLSYIEEVRCLKVKQSISIHRITEQYPTTFHFHLIMNKQYAYDGAYNLLYDPVFYEHRIDFFTYQLNKSSQDPSDDT